MRVRSLLLLFLAVACQRQPELPKLFTVPDAKLVDERGARVDLASMKGRVTVYDFIFTNCTGSCRSWPTTCAR